MLSIAVQRLHNQQISHSRFQHPAEVIAWLGAVQAQEYALAKWAIGLRMQTSTDEVIEAAFNKGEILRTHLMRPTWHFVTPTDIRWLLELTAPRVHQVNGFMYRKLELDQVLLHRSADLIAKALEGGKHLTRAELGNILVRNGIDATNGMRLGYIVHYAELEGIVCSGARRGKQHTYGLIAERAPQARRLTRDEALVELTLRYFTSHGPATIKDFAWWSGLTIADVKMGLTLLGSQVRQAAVDGETYWFSSSMPTVSELPSQGYLLPVYDEYTVAYKNRSAFLNPRYEPLPNDRFFISSFAYKGEVIGRWRRTFTKETVVIQLAPFLPLTSVEQAAFADAAHHFGDFLRMQVVYHTT